MQADKAAVSSIELSVFACLIRSVDQNDAAGSGKQPGEDHKNDNPDAGGASIVAVQSTESKEAF